MQLNTDDTEIEQYLNSMNKESDVMLNCDICKRLFYTNRNIAIKKIDAKIPILCPRCQKIKLGG